MPEQSRKPSRRERLLEVAREAFGRAPYEDVQLSAIAKNAEVAHGLPFHYFGNKRGLFIEVVRSIADEMRVLHAETTDLPPAAAVRGALDRHIGYFLEHPHLVLGPMRGNMLVDPQISEVFEESRWHGMRSTLAMVGIAEPTTGTELLMRSWLAFHDDVVARWLLGQHFERDKVVDLLYDSLLSTLELTSHLEPGVVFDPSELRAEALGHH